MQNPYVQALEFLVDAGVTVALMDEPNNRFEPIAPIFPQENHHSTPPLKQPNKNVTDGLKAHADIVTEAKKIASACNDLEALKTAIQNFNGIILKKTAYQIVFADGMATADVMVIGETPNTQDDRNGVPFTDSDGQLLDKIFACIDRNRKDNLYLTNVLNWRPPGNRSATAEELEITAPFIKRHIDLVKPKIIVCLGGIPAQILLGSKESISRLRGKFYDYGETKLIATYHPSSLLKTPLQKKKVWDDMLMLQGYLDEI